MRSAAGKSTPTSSVPVQHNGQVGSCIHRPSAPSQLIQLSKGPDVCESAIWDCLGRMGGVRRPGRWDLMMMESPCWAAVWWTTRKYGNIGRGGCSDSTTWNYQAGLFLYVCHTGRKENFLLFSFFFYSLKDSVSLVGFLSARVILGISAMVRFHVFLSISRDFPHQSHSTVPDNSSLVNTTASLPSHCLYWMS